MFCQGCGKEMEGGANFCSACGRKVETSTQPPPMPYQQRNLFRSRSNRMIAGVCAGLAYHFGMDPVVVRLITVVLFFLAGLPLLAYIIAWIVIPEEPLMLPGTQMVGPAGPVTPAAPIGQPR